jgi:MOSC domain-containing protein YiiM
MTCDLCGFRVDLWNGTDLDTTLSAVPGLAGHVLRGAPADLVPELTALLAPLADLPREGTDPDAVHTALHALHLAGRLRHQGTPTSTGAVVQVSASGGGVPKSALSQAEVTWRGLTGDRQDDRRHHGRPWQAVCLWSAEVVEGLQAEGHPIGFGSAGENLTLRGLDWGALSPGLRLRAGSTLLQLTSYAIPCAKNAQWFSDGGFRRMSHEVRPGGSRLYASVVEQGTVRPGDPVVVEPRPGG